MSFRQLWVLRYSGIIHELHGDYLDNRHVVHGVFLFLDR
jgi:hypothetical protein